MPVNPKNLPVFRSNENYGLFVTLPNGVTISTQFGWHHYCAGKDLPERNSREAINCEFAAWRGQTEEGRHQWCTQEVADAAGVNCGDDVIGYVTSEQWAKLVAAAAALSVS